jgi:DNA primase
MARIPAAEIERLKHEIALERLVESAGVKLTRHGADLMGLCPFHDDREPSLVISPKKNLWHCLGACQAGGTVIDWVMRMNGVSFRHAVELLRTDPSLAAGGKPIRQATVPKLPAPVAADADDRKLLAQVIDYYHEQLKASPEALAYLQSRGIDDPAAIERCKLGFANRTLGLRLPAANRAAGAEIRGRLQKLGVLRESGHEHFNGSLVIPVIDEAGTVTEIYGRKITPGLRPGTPLHLYLPGPHVGVWNIEALQSSPEIIVCEALIDALTFWCAGYRNVTAAYGVEGFTDDHLAAMKRHGTRRVLVAYDRDEAGDKAAEKLAQKLTGGGIECFRIQFPKGMDANEYALKVAPAAKSLGLAIRKAVWLGKGEAPVAVEPAVCVPPTVLPEDSPLAAKGEAIPAPVVETMVTSELEITDCDLKLPASPVPPAPVDIAAQVSDAEVVMVFGEGAEARRYRVRGLTKNTSQELLRVNVLVGRGEAFHVDTLDLYSAKARGAYLREAAAELKVSEEILKVDLGRVLLKLEALQDEQIRKALEPAPVAAVAIGDEAREAALALLRDPKLIERIGEDLEACGLVGERVNKLVAYLAVVSRKLDAPLAVLVQSASAAGKSSLMDAVLAMTPEEERIKYSAMTGQSLFYMGETNLKHKVLAIAEEEGAARATYALKLLQSEGELTMASTGKDPATGNLVTQEYRVEGPVMMFLTTTATDIDPELQNRCLVLSVDEDRAQTQAIHRLQRNRRTLDGLIARAERDEIRALHRNAQRLLRALAVMNPYAGSLTFPDTATRLRRDHEKYLTLIDAIALVHQHQRPIKAVMREGKPIEYVEVTLGDIETANALAHEVLGRSLDELPPQTRRVLMTVDAFVTQRAASQAADRALVRFSRRELREASTIGDTQLKLHLGRLLEFEYVIAHRRGPATEYELVYDGSGQDGRPFVPGLIDVERLRTATTADRSGVRSDRSGSSRPGIGPRSGGGQVAESAQDRATTRLAGRSPDKTSETHCSGDDAEIVSYSNAAVVPALPLAAAV